MTTAVVKIGKSQYLVTPGQEILVDKLSKDSGEVVFKEILLLIEDDKVTLGKPVVTGVEIVAKINGNLKGDKVRVSKFKAKSRYRKVTGIRPVHTKVLIQDIRFINDSPRKKPSEK